MSERIALPEKSIIPALAREAASLGGRLVIVGGWVRDQLRGEPSKDLDAEIFGLSPEKIDAFLDRFDSIGRVGQHFPVWRLKHRDIDIGYPREGALDYQAPDAATLVFAFRKAARHRDLTLNAIGWDPLDGQLLDPWQGALDLDAKRLRAVDPTTFGRDPLRGLRVARLKAHLEAEVDSRTLELCRSLDLSELPVERITGELRRILTHPKKPSLALEFLDQSGLLRFFPPLEPLSETPQDPVWHPEGDVFIHTMMVLDVARRIGSDLDPESAETLQWAALCHDLGKPSTTTQEGNRIRSIGHEAAGAHITRKWLATLRVSHRISQAAEVLVAHHLAPAQFVSQGAGPRAYRRLARKLAVGGASVIDLERVARADHLGRTTEEALTGTFPAGQQFLEAAEEEGVRSGPHQDIVTAKHLMSIGFLPGPMLGRALGRARDLQETRGGNDPKVIVELIRREFAQELDPDSTSKS